MVYVFIPAAHHGGLQSTVLRIVMHGTVSPCVDGDARAVANFFHNQPVDDPNPTSAHFVVDPSEVIQCVQENTIAWHDGTNTNSLGVELCDPQTGLGTRWLDDEHSKMLNTAAKLVADLCHRHDIPFVRLTPQQIRDGDKGICGHNDMRLAYPLHTTHTDPGQDFPWTRFLILCEFYSDNPLPAKPHPNLAPPIHAGDAMYLLCQTGTDTTTKRYGILTGFNLLELKSPGEKTAADSAMSKGVPFQWVEHTTFEAAVARAAQP